ncbi:hypothetical protein GCM10017559_44460 [Streptosporangium longisporum]|uniref:RNA polymerase sigma factor n=2 Tax=Streptosporangium longisporum TaxID=46187 RepID=A0ABN3Y6I2_9ACTN
MTQEGSAFAERAGRYRRELHVHCYRMLGSFTDAEDLVQETLLRAWHHRDGFDGGPDLRAWLYRIATNACLDAIRRDARRAGLLRSFADVPWLQPYPDRLLDEIAPAESEPDAVVVARQTIELTFLEYGTDLVGSIRIPAAFCGVYGLRPSAGIVPLAGFSPPGVPPGPDEAAYMTSAGPLARSAGDLRTALGVTAGPDGQAAKACSWTLPPSRHTRAADFRVGFVLDHPAAPVSAEVAGPLSDLVDALARTGATLVEGWPDGVDPVREAESFGFHVGLFLASQGPGGEFAPFSAIVEQQNRRTAARAAWNAHFGDVDVFLCPVTFTPAFPHDPRPFEERMIVTPEGERPYGDLPFWISHASLPGLPAVAAPIGRTPGGLPVGVQVVGPLYEDDTAITFAELLADVTGGPGRPPI